MASVGISVAIPNETKTNPRRNKPVQNRDVIALQRSKTTKYRPEADFSSEKGCAGCPVRTYCAPPESDTQIVRIGYLARMNRISGSSNPDIRTRKAGHPTTIPRIAPRSNSDSRPHALPGWTSSITRRKAANEVGCEATAKPPVGIWIGGWIWYTIRR